MLSVESGDDVEAANKTDSQERQEVVDEFYLTKGTGAVLVIFEETPIWLLSITPMAFRFICFPQFTSINHMASTSPIAQVIIAHFSASWLSSQLLFDPTTFPVCNLVLLSGTDGFIKNIDVSMHEAPILVSFERKHMPKVKDCRFKFCQF